MHLWLQPSCTNRAKACHRYEEKQGFRRIQKQAVHTHASQHTPLPLPSTKIETCSCAHYTYDAHCSQHNSLTHPHPRSAHTHTLFRETLTHLVCGNSAHPVGIMTNEANPYRMIWMVPESNRPRCQQDEEMQTALSEQ